MFCLNYLYISLYHEYVAFPLIYAVHLFRQDWSKVELIIDLNI